MLAGKRILLIIGGGIAAYKSLEVIRLLRRQGAAVRCILTAAGSRFVTPLSVAGLSGERVYEDLFSLTDEAEMGHIRLSREADLVVVAPATANLIARMAQGRADDLAATALLATDKPVLLAPAMNVRMWHHPATQENLARVIARGTRTVGPVEGSMACGEYGIGRLAEPPVIVDAIIAALTEGKPLAGRRAVVTAGPTLEAIDPIRFISNRSSGKQGYAIAAALAEAGAITTLVTGPTALPVPPGVSATRVEAATEMLAACQNALPADIAIFTAAVADWRVDASSVQKIKKQDGTSPPSLHLVENPDILRTVATLPKGRPALVIGFAAETQDLIPHARAKLARKGCDWIVANDVSPAEGVLGGDENTVHLVSAKGEETWPKLTKQEVARRLVERVVHHLGAGKP